LIKPRCKTSFVERFVSSTGDYFPCCWLAGHPDVQEFKKFLGQRFTELSLAIYTPEQIENSQAWKALEASWLSEKPFASCAFFCSGDFEDSARNTTDKSKVYR
jgi:hypothetical protein